ncbi:MAG: glycosyltransferase [Muribaculaceae bacterium]|nr:glycosyltransferase [Muribaculaceae bacterium]
MKDIGILILTYNAPQYVKETLETLHNVTDPEDLKRCEIVVWDNNSEEETKRILKEYQQKGYIDKLRLSDENLLFAGGNNEASKLAGPDVKYYLLLNSDVRIKDPKWLKYLLDIKEDGNYGGISYGFCKNPDRCDGYCWLVDKPLFDRYLLDTAFQWWWGVTKLQSQMITEGINLLGLTHHDHILHHYGGKSGDAFKVAKGLHTKREEVIKWFEDKPGKVYHKSILTKGNLLRYLI